MKLATIIFFFWPLAILGQIQNLPEFRTYVCSKTTSPMIIDGNLNEQAWEHAEWSSSFIDIEGSTKAPPKYDTKVKMLWDSTYLYIGALLEEEHLWATYDQDESIIFHENDFEIFIDPDGDTHQYFEIEINALGTIWDLMLVKPYRDGGPAITGWDSDGMKRAIQLQGTLNDPSDKDTSWTVEMAIPLADLVQTIKHKPLPSAGTIWRINFSRVQWNLTIEDGAYHKQIDAGTGQNLKEMNWVWSAQGAINMHMPEMWGYLKFTDNADKDQWFNLPAAEITKWNLRLWYYKLRARKKSTGSYLGLTLPDEIEASRTPQQYILSEIDSDGQKWNINHEGKVWKSK